LVRVEPNFAIPAPQCLGLREREQPAAQPYALARGGNEGERSPRPVSYGFTKILPDLE
jgi:hypothetical protein